jgi:hypothetical protein
LRQKVIPICAPVIHSFSCGIHSFPAGFCPAFALDAHTAAP